MKVQNLVPIDLRICKHGHLMDFKLIFDKNLQTTLESDLFRKNEQSEKNDGFNNIEKTL